jgi:hypothetical protein
MSRFASLEHLRAACRDLPDADKATAEAVSAREARLTKPPGSLLPMDATQPVVVGALIGWLYDRAMDKRGNAEMAKRFGVLLASGLIVGESLLGVLNAGLIVATGQATPLALVGESFAGASQWMGMLLLGVIVAISYRWVSRQSELGS